MERVSTDEDKLMKIYTCFPGIGKAQGSYHELLMMANMRTEDWLHFLTNMGLRELLMKQWSGRDPVKNPAG